MKKKNRIKVATENTTAASNLRCGCCSKRSPEKMHSAYNDSVYLFYFFIGCEVWAQFSTKLCGHILKTNGKVKKQYIIIYCIFFSHGTHEHTSGSTAKQERTFVGKIGILQHGQGQSNFWTQKRFVLVWSVLNNKNTNSKKNNNCGHWFFLSGPFPPSSCPLPLLHLFLSPWRGGGRGEGGRVGYFFLNL